MNPYSFENFETNVETKLNQLCESIPSPLKESIQYSVKSGGKRVRPRLLYQIGDAFQIEPETLFTLALSVELVHTYTLIHDDLPCMDNDDERRGKPTNHIVFGESTALLAGDALQSLAIECLMTLEKSSDSKILLKAVKILVQAMGGKKVIAGQVSEKLLETNPSFETLIKVFALKTGSLFVPCLLLPALFSPKLFPHFKIIEPLLEQIGNQIGIAFQMADDLEDEKTMTEEYPPTHIRAYLKDSETLLWVKKYIENTPSSLFQSDLSQYDLKKVIPKECIQQLLLLEKIIIEILNLILMKCEQTQ